MTTQLEEIEKLYAKEKTYLIPREPKEDEEQATIKIMQIDLDEAATFDFKKEDSVEETVKKGKELISKSTGIPVEKLGKLALAYLFELLDCIVEANNLPKDQKEGIGKMKGFLTEKRAQIEAEKDKAAAPNERAS